jgi:ABC-type multidrug transport system ATPase subunit
VLVPPGRPIPARCCGPMLNRDEWPLGADTSTSWDLLVLIPVGTNQRVEIARALMGHPKVLFLDEPTCGLDLPAKREMWNLLRDPAKREQVTTILSSQDAQEIRNLCSEISVIAKGKIIYTAATSELGTDADAFEERLIELLTHGESTD